MYYPKFLKEGNWIAVPALSAGSDCQEKKNKLLNAKKNLEELGYKILLSKNIFQNINGRSGTAEERAVEINEMFKNDDIDFILCAMGGEFLLEILPYVDFELLKNTPKFVAGFSDPTGLLYPITTKYDIATIYGQNFSSLGNKTIFKNQQDFLEIIKGNIVPQQSFELYEETPFERATGLEDYNLTEKVYWNTLDNMPINVKGRIIGGCFDIISDLAGTQYDGINEFNEKYAKDGIIWYFDNCEISMEETIRTLWRMNQLEYFKYAKCIIFGRFGSNITNLNYNIRTCLQDSILSKLNTPIVFDADISHKAPCLTIINGSIATLNIREGKAEISFELE